MGLVGDASSQLYTYTHILSQLLLRIQSRAPCALRQVLAVVSFMYSSVSTLIPSPRPFPYGDLTLVFCEEFAVNAAQLFPVLAIEEPCRLGRCLSDTLPPVGVCFGGGWGGAWCLDNDPDINMNTSVNKS